MESWVWLDGKCLASEEALDGDTLAGLYCIRRQGGEGRF